MEIGKGGMIIAALVVAFLVLLIVLLFILLANKADKQKVVAKDNFNEKVKEVFYGSSNLEAYLRGIVKNEVEKNPIQTCDNQICMTVGNGELEKWIRDIVRNEMNTVIRMKNDGQEANVTRDSRVIESVLYACAVNESDGTFYDVTMIPNSETIYLLKVEKENLASFEVYEKMFDKVKEEQGHLKCGCDVENYTMGVITSMQTNVMGQAARQDDGKWKVTKKANVIFK